MEKSYGIEAARAQLGEIADHARATGEVISLTRHGRTVAVIGPARSVTPMKGVEAILLFPGDRDWGGQLPGVPAVGHTVQRENERAEETWTVSRVEWYLADEGRSLLFVHLQPADDYTKRLAKQWQSESPTRRTQK
ncbi:hypothetical protein [Streptomyces sp. NPDC047868]|uniref:type II toxin-antitoxin system Phd/YefM family antitoxin n=1 Tax=Streptomyces sp. NPDC047868 TaxID=3155480 RepID=UPI00345375DD